MQEKAVANNAFFIVQIRGLDKLACIELVTSEINRLKLSHTLFSDNTIASLQASAAGNPLAIKLSIAQLRYGADDPLTFISGTSLAGQEVFSFIFDKCWENMDEDLRSLLMAAALFS